MLYWSSVPSAACSSSGSVSTQVFGALFPNWFFSVDCFKIRTLLQSRRQFHHTSIYHSTFCNVIYHHDCVAHMLPCVMKYQGWWWTVGILFFPHCFNCYQPSGSFLAGECNHFFFYHAALVCSNSSTDAYWSLPIGSLLHSSLSDDSFVSSLNVKGYN